MSTETLCDILAVRRPYKSPEEDAFVKAFIVDPLKAAGHKPLLLGPMENVVVVVPPAVEGSKPTNEKILFSCHTDTVHHFGGPQQVLVDSALGHAFKSDNTPLGADDGTGVWLMLEMIAAGVPGTYVFHRGEEVGCVGSKWIAANEQKWLKSFDIAIAFDRKDTGSIITFQRARRCCSDEFGDALAKGLNAQNDSFKFIRDETGVFTDTANYTALIRECTNISVGYMGAHTDMEIQDLHFAAALREALIKLDWEALPAVREAKEEPYRTVTYSGGGGFDDWADNYAAGIVQSSYNSKGNGPPGLVDVRKMMMSAQEAIPIAQAAVRIAQLPPASLNAVMLQHDLYDKRLVRYLTALVRQDPAIAVQMLWSGLAYFHYYTTQLSVVENRYDSGPLGLSPLQTLALQDCVIKDPVTGALVRRKPDREVRRPPREEVVAARNTRKANKKARKHHRGAVRPSSNPMARGVRKIQPLLDFKLPPRASSGPEPSNDSYAG